VSEQVQHRPPPGPDDFPESGPNALGSVGARVFAYVIDAILLFIPTALVMLLFFTEVADAEVTVAELPWWFVPAQVAGQVAYQTVLVGTWGTTVGKWILGLKIVRYADGTRPDLARAAQRALVPAVPAVLPVDIAGVLSAAVSATFVFMPLRRGWPDLYAGTIVIRTR